VGGSIALCYLIALMATSRLVGITRDETYRIDRARDATGWFRELSKLDAQENAATVWSRPYMNRFWNERVTARPTIMQPIMGISHMLLNPILGGLHEMLEYRLPTMVLSALLAYLVFLIGADLGGILAGAASALVFCLLPRVFFDAHLACLDAAVTSFAVLGLFGLTRAVTRKEKRWIAIAVAGIGLTVATKNSLPLVAPPVALILLYFLFRGMPQRVVNTYLWLIPGVAVIFLLSWPPFLVNPRYNILFYITCYLDTPHHPWMYVGSAIGQPPFPMAFPFVYTAATTPVPFLVLALVGVGIVAFDLAKRRSDHLSIERALVIGMAFLPILIIAHPRIHHYGGTKHWMLSTPYMAVLAGTALVRVIRHAGEFWKSRRLRLAITTLAAALVFLPGVLGTASTAPWGHTYYNGLWGWNGLEARMQAQYWGDSTNAILPWLNANLPRGARVFLHRTEPRAPRIYQTMRLMRPDLKWTVNISEAEWHLFHYKQTFYRDLIAISFFRHEVPYYTITTWDGAPMVSIFGPAKAQPVMNEPGEQPEALQDEDHAADSNGTPAKEP